MKRLGSIVSLVLAFAILLTGCAAPSANTASSSSTASSSNDASSESGEVKDFVTWYQYDQNNEDPASDERVGNEYLRQTIPQFNEQFKGKWNWINQPKAFDKMAT